MYPLDFLARRDYFQIPLITPLIIFLMSLLPSFLINMNHFQVSIIVLLLIFQYFEGLQLTLLSIPPSPLLSHFPHHYQTHLLLLLLKWLFLTDCIKVHLDVFQLRLESNFPRPKGQIYLLMFIFLALTSYKSND